MAISPFRLIIMLLLLPAVGQGVGGYPQQPGGKGNASPFAACSRDSGRAFDPRFSRTGDGRVRLTDYSRCGFSNVYFRATRPTQNAD